MDIVHCLSGDNIMNLNNGSSFRLPRLKSDVSLTAQTHILNDQKMLVDDMNPLNKHVYALQLIYSNLPLDCLIDELKQNLMKHTQHLEYICNGVIYVDFAHFLLDKSNEACILDQLFHIKFDLLGYVVKHISNIVSDGMTREKLAKHILSLILPELEINGKFKSITKVSSYPDDKSVRNQLPLFDLLHYMTMLIGGRDSMVNLITTSVIRMLGFGKSGDMDISTDTQEPEIKSDLLSVMFVFRTNGLIKMLSALLQLFKSSLGGHEITDEEHLEEEQWTITNLLIRAVKKGYLNVLKYLIETTGMKFRLAGIDQQDRSQLLIAAIITDQLEIIKYLLTQMEPPVNVNAQCTMGNAALHVAVDRNKIEIVRILLETGGATVDIRNEHRNHATPLHIASAHGYKSIAKLLVEHSANPSIRTSQDNLTAIQLAERAGHSELSKFLQNRARMNTATRKGDLTHFVHNSEILQKKREHDDKMDTII